MMRFFPSDAAAWASLRVPGLPAAGPSMVGATPASEQEPQLERKAIPRKEAEAGIGGAPITERKAQVLPESFVAQALVRYGKRVAESVASRAFLGYGQAEMRVSALGAHGEALWRECPDARSLDWLTPALQATVNLHPVHREQALQQVLRPALSSTLAPAKFKASLDSVGRALVRADGEARRATFAALAKLLSMPHRDPSDALALLETAHGFRAGVAYDDAALLVTAAMRRVAQRPIPDLATVSRAALALLDADNCIAADQEPIVNLGIELGRQARGATARDKFEALLAGMEAVAGGWRADQLGELARGCLSGLGGTQIEPSQRDAWIAFALRLDEALALPALHSLWEGAALGLLAEGAPGGGFVGALDAPQRRSGHMGALVAAALARADSPLKVGALMAGVAAASNKLHEGPGTLGDLLQRVDLAQSRLSASAAFTAGCALARACWLVKDGLRAWARARGPAASGDRAGELDAKGVAAFDPVGTGWRFGSEPETLLGEAGGPPSPPVELVVLAWSLPGMPGEQVLPKHLRWLALAPLLPAQRMDLAAQLLEKIEGRVLRRVFPQARDLLLQACAEADAVPGAKTGHRPLVLRAMNALMLVYDRWLTDPQPQDRDAVSAQHEETQARKDLPPDLRLMILDRLEVHLTETKSGPRPAKTAAYLREI